MKRRGKRGFLRFPSGGRKRGRREVLVSWSCWRRMRKGKTKFTGSHDSREKRGGGVIESIRAGEEGGGKGCAPCFIRGKKEERPVPAKEKGKEKETRRVQEGQRKILTGK